MPQEIFPFDRVFAYVKMNMIVGQAADKKKPLVKMCNINIYGRVIGFNKLPDTLEILVISARNKDTGRRVNFDSSLEVALSAITKITECVEIDDATTSTITKSTTTTTTSGRTVNLTTVTNTSKYDPYLDHVPAPKEIPLLPKQPTGITQGFEIDPCKKPHWSTGKWSYYLIKGWIHSTFYNNRFWEKDKEGPSASMLRM